MNNHGLNQAGSAPNCSCGIPAQELSVVKESTNKGRKFWTCGHHPEKRCQFFEWMTGTSESTTQSGKGVEAFARPIVPAKRPLVRTRRGGPVIDLMPALFRRRAGIAHLTCLLDANATNQRSRAPYRRKDQIKGALFGAVRNRKQRRVVSSLGRIMLVNPALQGVRTMPA